MAMAAVKPRWPPLGSMSILLLVVTQLKTVVSQNESTQTHLIMDPVCFNETYGETDMWKSAPMYATNLATLRNDLADSAKTRLYNDSSVGSGNNTVYGTYQCRGDLKFTDCYSCVISASTISGDKCASSLGARIELDACSFFYQNSAITPNFTFLNEVHDSNSPTNDSTYFTDARLHVIRKASSAAPFAPNYWSSASEDGVYAGAQCHGYLTPDECKKCLSNATESLGKAYIGQRVTYGSCITRYEIYLFFTPMPILSSASGKHKRSNGSIIIGSVVAGFLLCIVGVIAYWKRRSVVAKLSNAAASPEPKLRLFSLEEIKAATKSFENEIGRGGFGNVYKGILRNGQQIAVKKLKCETSTEGKAFQNEVHINCFVEHPNVVRLLGYCSESSCKCLILEYVPKLSLDKHLHGNSEDQATNLSWNDRYKIIRGVANGLKHLHNDSEQRVIHRDIKPANILLDENMEPKIADFGVSRLFPFEITSLQTKFAGTRHFAPPEALRKGGKVSDKYDTYSFGMVVLVIVSGRRAYEETLLECAWKLYKEGRLLELMDRRLISEVTASVTQMEVCRIITIALLCTQKDNLRPSMLTVVNALGGSDELPLPRSSPQGRTFSFLFWKSRTSIKKWSGSCPLEQLAKG